MHEIVPDARSRDERRRGEGSNAPPIAAPESRSRAQIENSSKDEVDALAPTLTTDRKRTDLVGTCRFALQHRRFKGPEPLAKTLQ